MQYTTGNWAPGATDGSSGTTCPCTLPTLPKIKYNSPRLGSWAATAGATGTMDRSMRGSIAVFRLWDKLTNGEDRCPGSGSAHLVVNYMFDSLTDVLKDRSGNSHDATIHDTKYSADYPDLSCIFHKDQMWKMMVKTHALPLLLSSICWYCSLLAGAACLLSLFCPVLFSACLSAYTTLPALSALSALSVYILCACPVFYVVSAYICCLPLLLLLLCLPLLLSGSGGSRRAWPSHGGLLGL